MKDIALQLAASREGQNSKLNALREYVQAYMLRILYEQKFFVSAAFVGGTALRFLYNLPRFSEDIDFSLAKPEAIDFPEQVSSLNQELSLSGYTVSLKQKTEKMVFSAMFKFKGLLYEAGLSPLPAEDFSIKLELDTNPPQGADLESRVVNKHFLITFLSYDVRALFTSKVSALLSRNYTKGRDFFDLGWYLATWPDLSPNFELLKNGLIQVGWKEEYPSLGTWRHCLQKVVEKADWKAVFADVKNFLDNPLDAEIFTKENILQLLKVP